MPPNLFFSRHSIQNPDFKYCSSLITPLIILLLHFLHASPQRNFLLVCGIFLENRRGFPRLRPVFEPLLKDQKTSAFRSRIAVSDSQNSEIEPVLC
jgi:hypothetical protein